MCSVCGADICMLFVHMWQEICIYVYVVCNICCVHVQRVFEVVVLCVMCFELCENVGKMYVYIRCGLCICVCVLEWAWHMHDLCMCYV